MQRSGNVKRPLLFIFFTVMLLSSLIGCQSTPKMDNTAPFQNTLQTYDESEVKLSPGDILDIRFFYSPTLNVVQPVRPDGIISLLLIGEVKAQGKTPKELRDELNKRYSQYLKELDITIIIQSQSNRIVYVGGQVSRSGSVPMTGKLTVLEAIMQSGGVTLESGEYQNVLVLRNIEGKWQGIKVDLEKVINGEDTNPYFLQPLDIVYIPETKVYKVSRWIDQHIRSVFPDIGIGYTINSDGTSAFGATASLIPNN